MYCIRLSVGLSSDWVQGGDPLYTAVFSVSSCHCHICPILVIFCKKCMPRILQSWSKKFGSKYYSNHLKLRVSFQNWGQSSVMKPHAIAAEAFPKLRGVPYFWKTSWHPAMIKRSCNRQGNDKKLLFQNWGQVLNSGKKRPPLESNRLFWGLKHSENGRHFLHTFLTFSEFTFC